MTHSVDILRADYTDPRQRSAIPSLLNAYAKGLLGFQKEIESIARDLDCCKITLEVQENNTTARRLYRRNGFKDSFLDQEAGDQLSMTKNVD